jgi:hypothetical protein
MELERKRERENRDNKYNKTEETHPNFPLTCYKESEFPSQPALGGLNHFPNSLEATRFSLAKREKNPESVSWLMSLKLSTYVWYGSSLPRELELKTGF